MQHPQHTTGAIKTKSEMQHSNDKFLVHHETSDQRMADTIYGINLWAGPDLHHYESNLGIIKQVQLEQNPVAGSQVNNASFKRHMAPDGVAMLATAKGPERPSGKPVLRLFSRSRFMAAPL